MPLNAAFIKNVNEVVVCWNTRSELAVKRNKTRDYFFENLMDSFMVWVLTLGRRMRKLLGVHQHYSNLRDKNWNFFMWWFSWLVKVLDLHSHSVWRPSVVHLCWQLLPCTTLRLLQWVVPWLFSSLSGIVYVFVTCRGVMKEMRCHW